MWKVLLGVVGIGLLVTNCTIQSDDDTSCEPGTKKNCNACDGDVTGTQTCLDDGTYAACFCPSSTVGGGSNGGGSSGGASGAGASSSEAGSGGVTLADAGATSSSAGEGGSGGDGGAGSIPVDPNDCYDCLIKRCAIDWDFCAAEDENNPDPQDATRYCLSANADGTGQIEKVISCITTERAKGLVKRDVVRACGASVGQSADPSFFLWPPEEMTAATAGVMNCMADALDEEEPGTWADSNNIPTSGSPKPWLDNTCAKLSCTSAQLPE